MYGILYVFSRSTLDLSSYTFHLTLFPFYCCTCAVYLRLLSVCHSLHCTSYTVIVRSITYFHRVILKVKAINATCCWMTDIKMPQRTSNDGGLRLAIHAYFLWPDLLSSFLVGSSCALEIKRGMGFYLMLSCLS